MTDQLSTTKLRRKEEILMASSKMGNGVFENMRKLRIRGWWQLFEYRDTWGEIISIPDSLQLFWPLSVAPCTQRKKSLLAEVYGIFLVVRQMPGDLYTPPSIIWSSPLSLAVRCDWRDTRGNWPLARNPNRIWWHRHTSIKLFSYQDNNYNNGGGIFVIFAHPASWGIWVFYNL